MHKNLESKIHFDDRTHMLKIRCVCGIIGGESSFGVVHRWYVRNEKRRDGNVELRERYVLSVEGKQMTL